MKKKIIFTLFLSINNLLVAQIKTSSKIFEASPKEKIFIHMNTNFILTGERLYYKAYSLFNNNTISNISKIAYIELFDAHNKSHTKQKIKLEGGVGNGDLFIGTNLKTGTYKLIGYTQLASNYKTFFQENIFIINPFTERLNTKQQPYSNLINESLKDINLTSLIQTSKKTYRKREQVKILLDNELPTGNYSISVNQKNPTSIPSIKNAETFSKIKHATTKNDTFQVPEVRGNIIKGKIISENQSFEINNITLGLTTSDENPITKTSVTNKYGEFYFILEKQNSSKVNLQVLNDLRENYEIILEEEKPLNENFKNYESLYIDENLSKIISQKSIYTQIENSYSSIKKDSSFSSNKDSFFDDKKTVYLLDDYKRFKTVKEVIVEVLANVFHTEKKGQKRVHVRNIDKETYTDTPTLIIVDGHILYNHNDFFEINANTINKISVLRNKYFFGTQIYQGIMFVETLKKDYKPNTKFNKEFTVLSPKPEKKYYTETYLNDKKERIPDYRTQLYWNPNLKSINKEVTFYTSDALGNYEIRIEGFTNDGKPVSLISEFSVE